MFLKDKTATFFFFFISGIQMRDVSCARNSDFKVVPDYLCDPQLRPTSNQSCNVDECPPR